MSAAKKAILKALIENTLTELMVKTNVDNVYIDDNTTLASKLADMISALNAKATPADVTKAIADLKAEILGDTPVDAYDTFTELAQYIATHKEAADALTAAVGNKADKTTVEAIQKTVNALGSLSKLNSVSESNLDSALKAKINNAASANHSHANKTVLDGITSAKVASWDSKGKVYYGTSAPADLTANDLFIQIS